MENINDIFRTFGPEYLERYGEAIPLEHRKAIQAICDCRTEACGTALYRCEQCGQSHLLNRSCGNRHCPTCQHHKTRAWLEKQLERQLPGHHFLITFTVPEPLRRFIRTNQRRAYSAMFKASSESLRKLAADAKYMGGNLPGYFGVLHTWGRTLDYHPHIHYIVAGGALSSAKGTWHPSRLDFYLPVKALSKIFQAKFRLPMSFGWPYPITASFPSRTGLLLSAIANPVATVWRTLALEVLEFIRRFLQHVLPTGFMKVRYFGFMNTSCTVTLEQISSLIQLAHGFDLALPESELEPLAPMVCPKCGGTLKLLFVSFPYLYDHFAASG